MSEHSANAIAAYPYREHSNPDVYEVMKSWTDDHRTAFDRGMAVTRAVQQGALTKKLAGLWNHENQSAYVPWAIAKRMAESILASGALLDVREVQAQTIESLAPLILNTGVAKYHAARIRAGA